MELKGDNWETMDFYSHTILYMVITIIISIYNDYNNLI